MALDTKQYLEELFKAAGTSVDDAQKQAVMAVFSNETVAKRLGDDVLRQQDYSRNMDALKAEKDKTTQYYTQLVQWKAEQEALLNADPVKQPVIQPVQGDFISKKDHDEEMKRRDGQFIGLLKTGLNIVQSHMTEFKEKLDLDALEKSAVERNLTLQQAYDQMVAPRRADAQKASYEEAIKRAKEDGAREFASTHKIPVDSGPKEYHVIADRDLKKQVEYDPAARQLTPAGKNALRSAFVEEWEKSLATNTSG